MIRRMKAMKHLLIVISLMSILSLNAQTMVEYPVAQMQSTSSMVGSGSTLPNAASSGFISADDNLPSSSPRGPRRVIDEDDKDEEKPESWEDPFKDPLTDAVPCLLLLALGYVIYLRRKKSVTTLDSKNKQ